MNNILNFIYLMCKYIVLFTTSIAVLIVIIQVICRTFFNFSFPWASELAKYMIIWTTFIGTTMVVKDKEMAALESIKSKLNIKIRKFYKLFIQLISLIFVLFLLFLSIKLLIHPSIMNQHSSALGISMLWVYLSLPICAFLMSIYLLLDFFLILKGEEEE